MTMTRNRAAVVTLAAAGAAMLGAYALRRNARASRAFSLAAGKIKEHLASKAEEIGELTREAYDRIVERVVGEYRHMRGLTDQEFDRMTDDLKEDWEGVKKEFKPGKEAEA